MEEAKFRMHSDFIRILGKFVRRYGEVIGTQKYIQFVAENDLQQDISYADMRQLRQEGMEWITEPLIRYMQDDEQAKYYNVLALTAEISMNNNDYTNVEELEKASVSMNFMPCNYNHNHNRWISYPNTRMDWSTYSNGALNGILRVDRSEDYLIKCLDHDSSVPKTEWISHPSIEARDIPADLGGGYHFTGLALLQMGKKLPGDPLTEIVPIFQESMEMSIARELKDNGNTGVKFMNETILSIKKEIVDENTDKNKDTPIMNQKIEKQDEVKNESPTLKVEPEITEQTKEEKPKEEVSNIVKGIYEVSELKKEQSDKDILITELQREKAILHDKLADITRTNSKLEKLKLIIDQLTDDNLELKQKVEDAEVKIVSLNGNIKGKKEQIKTLNDVVKKANTHVAEIKGKMEHIQDKLKQANIDKSTAKLRANEEIKQRSEIQSENATLHEDMSEITKKYSEAIDKTSINAKRLLTAEKSVSDLKQSNRILTEAVQEKDKLLESATRHNNRLHKTLKQNNILIVDDNGNVKL